MTADESIASSARGSAAPAGAQFRARALSLDALRGFAILGMVLSSMLPYFHGALPPWMYHAQLPPPDNIPRPDIRGITWVDIVFPLFLFCMGAAIPLAFSARMQDGASRWRLAMGILWRGILLLFFSLYVRHLGSNTLQEVYGTPGYLLSMLAFLPLALILTRLPESWPSAARGSLHGLGWIGAAVLLLLLQFPGSGRFSLHRHDPIFAILANVAVTSAWVWLLFPYRIATRVLLMALIVAIHFARQFSAWGLHYTELSALRTVIGDRAANATFWLFDPTYQKYLLITIPGTIAGDMLLVWLRPAAQRLSFKIQHSRWRELSQVQCLCLALVSAALAAAATVGLTFNDVRTTASVVAPLLLLGLALLYGAPGRRKFRGSAVLRGQSRVPGLLFQRLFAWGTAWMILGLLMLPYQGGIRHEPPTLSFFFITAGVATFLLIFFAVITEAFHRPGCLFLLIGNGQNPLIAYVAGSFVILPLLHLIPAGGDGSSVLEWLVAHSQQPWPAFARAAGLTLLVAAFVQIWTHLRLFWRA